MAPIFARILSSVFNYFVNRTVVFKSEANHTVVKYYSLSKEEKDSHRSLLEQYQYIALIKNDQSSCISSFISNEAAGAYKINKVDDKIWLE